MSVDRSRRLEALTMQRVTLDAEDIELAIREYLRQRFPLGSDSDGTPPDVFRICEVAVHNDDPDWDGNDTDNMEVRFGSADLKLTDRSCLFIVLEREIAPPLDPHKP